MSTTLRVNNEMTSDDKQEDYAKISVIVPVYNEAKHIESVLDQLISQQYPDENYEILVVDGLSTDGTPDLIQKYVNEYVNIHLLMNPKRLSSYARNIGIKAAKGDIILIVDGHCIIPHHEILANVNKMMKNPEIDALGRPQPLLQENLTPIQNAIALARSSRLGHQPDSFIYSDKPQLVPAQSVAVAYRRKVFDQIGLFDEKFDACEDCELNQRFDNADFKCYFTPDIGVYYVPRDSFSKLWKQMIRYGTGRVRLERKHPGSCSLKLIVPALFVIGLVTGAVFSFLSKWIALIYLGVLAFYGVMIFAESCRLSIKNRFPFGILLIPAALITVHLASGTGLILESLFGKRIRSVRKQQQ